MRGGQRGCRVMLKGYFTTTRDARQPHPRPLSLATALGRGGDGSDNRYDSDNSNGNDYGNGIGGLEARPTGTGPGRAAYAQVIAPGASAMTASFRKAIAFRKPSFAVISESSCSMESTPS